MFIKILIEVERIVVVAIGVIIEKSIVIWRGWWWSRARDSWVRAMGSRCHARVGDYTSSSSSSLGRDSGGNILSWDGGVPSFFVFLSSLSVLLIRSPSDVFIRQSSMINCCGFDVEAAEVLATEVDVY